MKRKILSLILAICVLFGTLPAFAEGADITVYLSVSRYSELVSDKNGDLMAYREVELSGKDSYILDDVFFAAHELYYDGGTEGYASSRSDWGFGIDKLWGDTSYNFGYQLNGEMAMGLDDIVCDGDYIDAYIYKNNAPNFESYAKFDIRRGEAYEGEEFELTLSYVTGYEDGTWANIFSPCADATIFINGAETDFVTDSDGKAMISVTDVGEAIITAAKTKTVNDAVMTAITAPVSVMEIKEDISLEIIHNIAQMYVGSDLTEAGGNLPWIIADLAVYEELFPESENVLTEPLKERYLSELVEFAASATVPGDMAKSIIALRALGYDARKLYTADFEKVDVVSRLAALVDSADSAVFDIYTLPYVIIALGQAGGYATAEQMEALVTAAALSKADWHALTYGTDAMTPMILALAPYYSTNDEVKTAVDEAVVILKEEQRADGLIDGYEGYEPASTALAICAYSALGENAMDVKNGGRNLIFGMLSSANRQQNGFSNAFATEQGFRGFLAWQLLAQNKGKRMYDFSDYEMNEANVSGAVHCPVVFSLSPSGAVATIDGVTKIRDNCFDLEAGTYTYTVTASGYETATGSIEITEEDVSARLPKTVSASLAIIYSGGVGGGSVKDDPKPTPEPEATPEPEETPEPEVTFTADTFADVGEDDWYYQSVKYAYENGLFSGTGNGFEPNTAMSRAMLVSVLFRIADTGKSPSGSVFSDVQEGKWYTESINWAAESGIVSGVSETEFAPDSDITREQIALIIYRFATYSGYDMNVENADLSAFSDSENISDYAKDAVGYLVGKGIMNGKGAGELAPRDKATRAEVATMLMKFLEGVK